MFIGTYTRELDYKGRFTIPKPFRIILTQNAADDKAFFFAAADALRVYTQSGVQGYVEELERHVSGANGMVAVRLLRDTLSSGLAFYSGSGEVAIPEVFMRRYRLSPGMRLSLLGCDEFFEIVRLRGEA